MPKTKGMLIAAIVVVAGAIAAAVILHFTAPKDTPIVAGGGSIYGKTSDTDSDGWSSQSSLSERASLHGTHGKNPYGIDLLTITNFDSNPGFNITGTGGWEILIHNPLPGGGVNPTPAVTFCSDSGCSADSSNCNPSSFDNQGPVYFAIRNGSQMYTTQGGPNGKAIQFVYFHDTTAGCTPQTCDLVSDVVVKTCNAHGATIFTSTCTQNPKKCQVQVGD